ncbi:hypothetical protein D1AOALGA4SA_7906 [Olavius algarvensis Delta 1 endosymbiont]|nr:hypothetical protein D1AOALGA4SA_7906 [Olavius algarvensis Delta 1 endosymbiont]
MNLNSDCNDNLRQNRVALIGNFIYSLFWILISDFELVVSLAQRRRLRRVSLFHL